MSGPCRYGSTSAVKVPRHSADVGRLQKERPSSVNHGIDDATALVAMPELVVPGQVFRDGE